jgi:pimeloyl-ACP methyl ester carboxylesterase
MGFSDPSESPSTASHVVDDLHALIAAAAIPTPIVFVGHSNGGLYGRLYAAEFPDDVAGMVFIDPNSVGLDLAAEAALDPVHLKKWRASDQADIEQVRRCVALARSGALTQNTKGHPACLDDPPNRDASLHRVLNEQMSRPSEQEAYLSETVDTYPQPDGGLPNAELVIQRVTFDFKDKPFIVMSGTNELGALPEVLRAKVRKAMLANQADLAAHSTRGKQVFMDVTTEDIQLTQPDAVARYVREVVQEVRARAASAPGT